MKVFVYGTLKKGGRLFLEEHAKDIRPAKIKGTLYSMPRTPFPFATVGGERIIEGEVHEYDPLVVWEVIDKIEAGYDRVKTETLDGEEVYVYQTKYLNDAMEVIKDGVWEN